MRRTLVEIVCYVLIVRLCFNLYSNCNLQVAFTVEPTLQVQRREIAELLDKNKIESAHVKVLF